MLLYDLLKILNKGIHLKLVGYDKSANITFNVWHGIRWQLVPEGVVENCEIRCVTFDYRNDYLVIECDLHFDAFKGCML